MSNQRLQKLMKDHNIPPLKIPKPSDPVILSGVEDPLLPGTDSERTTITG